MTAMPQMVALFNGVGGGAVFLISWAEFRLTDGFTGAADVHRDLLAVRGDRRLGLLLGLEHRVRQAPGNHPRPADHARRRRSRSSTCVLLRRSRSPPASTIAAGDHSEALFIGMLLVRGAARQRRRAADRRRRHAGRDLAAERLHRPLGGGDRDRAEQPRADRRGHDRRRLRLDPHEPDGGRDEPLDPGDRRRRLRRRRRGRGRRAAPASTPARCAPRAPPTRRSSSPTPIAS